MKLEIFLILIATLLFNLESIFIYNQLMSTKGQISSVCKLYSVYEEMAEEFLDETDVDGFFIRTFWTFHSPATGLFELVRDTTKDLLHSKFQSVPFFRFKVTAAINSQGRNQHFWKGNWISTRQFGSKLVIKPTIYRRFHYPKLNLRLDLQKQKTICSVIDTRIYLTIWTDKFKNCSDLKSTRLASFPQKVWTLRSPIHSCRSCQPGLPWNQTSLQELIFCWLQG